METAVMTVLMALAVAMVLPVGVDGAEPQPQPQPAPAVDKKLAYAQKFGRAPDHLNLTRAW